MKKKVVIIGGGFAGIQLIKCLNTSLFDVFLLDKINHHQFQPLFYQVATSQIEPSSISFPFRYIFKGKAAVQIRLTEVSGIDYAQNKVITTLGDFAYDYLVIAAGCKTNFFNNPGIEKNAFTLKSTYDAIAIRNHIITIFEKAVSAGEEERQFLLNLMIVGAGPTGVELAGAFAEIKNDILPGDYPGIDFSGFSIYLVEGSNNTLNAMSEHARKASAQYLKKLGVQIITGTLVTAYDGKSAVLSNGMQLPVATLIWAAGVKGNKLPGLPEDVWVANDRIKVNRCNQVSGFENIFAIGDIACMSTGKYPKGHPQVANVAINQAKLLAGNLKKMVTGRSCKAYEYNDLGAMATIGRNRAVVDLPFFRFKGYFAWFVWMFLHLMLILSVKNKLIIFINWAWTYLTKNSSLRLILK